jgi:cytidylate kinase
VSARPLVIAVDGPAASGKTTLARSLAEHFDLPFLDTGLLYRAVGKRLLDRGEPTDDPRAAARAAHALTPADLEDPGLRDEAVGRAASQVASLAPVREALLSFQREFGGSSGAVLAGRDIGTVVRPDASRKIFITASPEERAKRRAEELRSRGEPFIFDEVLDELRLRDARDSSRAVAPLVPAKDAFVLDTSELNARAAFAIARDFVAGSP